MTSEDGRGDTAPDWVIPAILVGIAALVIFAVTIGVVVARGASEPGTLPEQLEAYTECLHSNGATVPLVEARRDGGVAIVFEGSLLEGGFQPSSILDAVGACEDEMPSGIRIPGELLRGLDLGALGGLSGSGPFGGEFFEDEGQGPARGEVLPKGSPRGPHRRGGPDGFRFGPGLGDGSPFADLCEALEDELRRDLRGGRGLRETCDLTDE